MPKKITQEEAVARMSAAHNNFYNYDATVYVKAFDKLTVVCPVHSEFETTFINHSNRVKPRGCPSCADIRRIKTKTKPVHTFLDRASEVHGDRYDYSSVDYTNTRTKVEIICKNHKSFWQTPQKHMSGQGCAICAGKGFMTPERFTETATKVHGTTYDYSLVTELSIKSEGCKVPIICSVHGPFEQNFSNHLMGQGCAKCAGYGFNTSKQGILYVLTDVGRVKVGITNRDINVRIKEINKPDGNFKLLKAYGYASGTQCLNHETELLRYLRDNYTTTQGTFDGVTESFEDVDPISVLLFIDKLREYEEEKSSLKPCI